jgi:DNA-binding response OmpR family regulator
MVERLCLAGKSAQCMPGQNTVLLVEDDLNDVELMSVAFAQAASPFSLVSVSHGGEAIQYLAGEGEYADRERFPGPSLILLDLRLPYVDGFEVLRWMRKQSAAKMPPVVVLSYTRLEEDYRLVRQLGAIRFEIKPIDFLGAIALVERLAEFAEDAAKESALRL